MKFAKFEGVPAWIRTCGLLTRKPSGLPSELLRPPKFTFVLRRSFLVPSFRPPILLSGTGKERRKTNVNLGEFLLPHRQEKFTIH